MKPGTRPKPSALRLIDGDAGHRPPNKNEAKPKAAIPPCPAHLKPHAKKEWRRISKHLHRLGLLTQIDRAALAAYCQAWARWVEAEEKLAEKPDVVKTKNGNIIQNPYLAVSNRAHDQLMKCAAEFGMTPSSRTRAVTEAPETTNGFSKHKNRG